MVEEDPVCKGMKKGVQGRRSQQETQPRVSLHYLDGQENSGSRGKQEFPWDSDEIAEGERREPEGGSRDEEENPYKVKG